MINAVNAKFASLPAPGASLDKSQLKSSAKREISVTEEVTFASSGEASVLHAPNGVTVVLADGTRGTGDVTIPANCTFHFERKAEVSPVTLQATISTDIPAECTVLEIDSGSSVQKTAFGYYAGEKTLELSMTFAQLENEKPESGPVKIHKTDASGAVKCGAGYAFQIIPTKDIYDKYGRLCSDEQGLAYRKGTIVDTLVTDGTGYAQSKRLFPGSYILRETAISSTEGLIRQTKDREITVPAPKDGQSTQVNVEWPDETNGVDLLKVDDEDGKALKGVVFDVTNKTTGKVRHAQTDNEGKIRLTHLEPGSYVVSETATLPGYNLLAEPAATFVVDANGLIQGKASWTINTKNHANHVQIHKYDIVDGPEGQELPGASLRVLDSEGKVVDEWISGAEDNDADGSPDPHVIKALPAGTYTLEETIVPEGYEQSTRAITFEVTDSLEVQKVAMGNSPYRDVEISKKTLVRSKSDEGTWEDGQELLGAHMEITNEKGELVEEWISGLDENGEPKLDETGQPLPHTCKLPSGDYVLTETAPTPGYTTAESATFHVERREQQGDYAVQQVEMKDKPTTVRITKSDITDGQPVIGAVLTVKDRQGKEVDTWTTTREPHEIEQLPVGEYTLTEVTAPDGYEQAESITFQVKDTGEIQKVEMLDRPKPIVKGVTETEQTTPEETQVETETKKTEKKIEKEETPKEKPKENPEVEESPKTGDTTPLEWCLALMLMALCVTTVILMKRKDRR